MTVECVRKYRKRCATFPKAAGRLRGKLTIHEVFITPRKCVYYDGSDGLPHKIHEAGTMTVSCIIDRPVEVLLLLTNRPNRSDDTTPCEVIKLADALTNARG